ncbi:MAG: hypothetical protein F2813_05020, partial [Actinobacteria bacterium]|nr:hypothetical protein [Actinomycetota bacterium]
MHSLSGGRDLRRLTQLRVQAGRDDGSVPFPPDGAPFGARLKVDYCDVGWPHPAPASAAQPVAQAGALRASGARKHYGDVKVRRRVVAETLGQLQYAVDRAGVVGDIGAANPKQRQDPGKQQQRRHKLNDRHDQVVDAEYPKRGACRDQSDAGGICCDQVGGEEAALACRAVIGCGCEDQRHCGLRRSGLGRGQNVLTGPRRSQPAKDRETRAVDQCQQQRSRGDHQAADRRGNADDAGQHPCSRADCLCDGPCRPGPEGLQLCFAADRFQACAIGRSRESLRLAAGGAGFVGCQRGTHTARRLVFPAMTKANDLAFAGAAVQSEMIRSGRCTAREVIEATLARIEMLNPQINAFRVVFAEQALAEADAIDAAGATDQPMLGVPVAIKDDTDVKGERTAWGSLATDPNPVGHDADVVKRLRAAGAIVIGKTSVPELTIWPFTETLAFGATRNPW